MKITCIYFTYICICIIKVGDPGEDNYIDHWGCGVTGYIVDSCGGDNYGREKIWS